MTLGLGAMLYIQRCYHTRLSVLRLFQSHTDTVRETTVCEIELLTGQLAVFWVKLLG